MPDNGQTLRRPPMADVAATVIECAERSGRTWWTEWEGLQWSPTRLADGQPFHGADRLVLAMAALASGHMDRRWGTMPQLDGLDYRIRKIDRTRGIAIGDERLYNAELGRRKRGTGARHDSRIPTEVYARDARAREILSAASTIVSPALTRQGAAGLAQFLRVMALACMPKNLTHVEMPEGMPALRPLVADMACAMALSDLGIAPSRARAHGTMSCDSPAEPWMDIIREGPDVLAGCAILAETTVYVVFSTTLIEARRRRARPASIGETGPSTEMETQAASDLCLERQAVPAVAEGSRLIAELHSTAFVARPLQGNDIRHSTPDEVGQEYTLHAEVEASRLASEALSGI